MRKIVLSLFISSCYIVFTSCNNTTPERYFDIAVLNCNMMQGFAAEGMQRELESPTVRMVDGNKDKFAPMKRKEIVDQKIESLEPNLDRLRSLKETGDTKELLQASIALYDYVLPVYKNEYRQLAALYDEGAPKEEIQSYALSIEERYYPGFEELFNKLTAAGKPYAEKHHIKVNWDVRTSPW